MSYKIHQGNCLDILPTLSAESVQCCVTSPPYYGLRDYGNVAQIGQEETPEAFVANLVRVFREVRRVLKPDGILWLNLGDSYNGAGRIGHGTRQGYKQGTNRASAAGVDHVRAQDRALKPKDLIGIPWRVAFALQADGWYLRSDIIWHKPNPMPESVTDRCTKSHEYVFMLTKAEKYYYDAKAIEERSRGGTSGLTGGAYAPPGQPPASNARSSWKGSKFHTGKTAEHQLGRSQKIRERERNNGESNVDTKKRGHGSCCGIGETRNKRDVWTIATEPCKESHFAVMPKALASLCIRAGSKPGDTVLDPFTGAGTTGVVCIKRKRNFVGCELNPAYVEIAERRIGRVLMNPGFGFAG